MRNNDWLQNRMHHIWETLFPDLEKKNNIIIRFKGRWKNKFGHIKRLKNKDSEIVVNGYFQKEHIPEFIIDLTIAHEIIHYMHGFNSPLPRKYKHPHAGGIVTRELRNRGFGHMLIKEKEFIKTWFKTYNRIKEDL